MKRIFIHKIRLAFASLLSLMALYSCTDWDDFKEYTKDGEIQYAGKMDSVKIFSGKGRVLYKGQLSADPKVKTVKIFWNDRKDSVEYQIEKGVGKEPFERTFAVDEGVKNFVTVTYDAAGNASIPVNAIGTSYGNTYRRRLNNRLISLLDFETSRTVINWDAMDLSTGAQYTEVEYVVNGETKVITTPVSTSKTVLEGLTESTTIKYRTIFKPEPTSIDTFAVAFQNYAINIVPQLKNKKVPFIATATSGRWGNLANWITNDAAKNHGGFGGWDEWNGNIFNVESGWGSPPITNGKIYQTLTLDPGTYTFEISNLRDTNLTPDDKTYLVVALGNTLPDVEQVTTSLGHTKIYNGRPIGELRVTFTVQEKSEVSMGYLTTQPDGWPGKYCNIIAFDFYKN
ncbi:DUF4998 domain-containing protein [Rufibacter aurantiacus]|uniref:DUF4998 domain-containing protein n=1 Tax=Rufibacter aurantiacus TaxID=2817374 RepID=UPI001B3153B2|nr:DUF4998 domain-containing protein [Rufibacter aurantiacus]